MRAGWPASAVHRGHSPAIAAPQRGEISVVDGHSLRHEARRLLATAPMHAREPYPVVAPSQGPPHRVTWQRPSTAGGSGRRRQRPVSSTSAAALPSALVAPYVGSEAAQPEFSRADPRQAMPHAASASMVRPRAGNGRYGSPSNGRRPLRASGARSRSSITPLRQSPPRLPRSAREVDGHRRTKPRVRDVRRRGLAPPIHATAPPPAAHAAHNMAPPGAGRGWHGRDGGDTWPPAPAASSHADQWNHLQPPPGHSSGLGRGGRGAPSSSLAASLVALERAETSVARAAVAVLEGFALRLALPRIRQQRRRARLLARLRGRQSFDASHRSQGSGGGLASPPPPSEPLQRPGPRAASAAPAPRGATRRGERRRRRARRTPPERSRSPAQRRPPSPQQRYVDPGAEEELAEQLEALQGLSPTLRRLRRAQLLSACSERHAAQMAALARTRPAGLGRSAAAERGVRSPRPARSARRRRPATPKGARYPTRLRRAAVRARPHSADPRSPVASPEAATRADAFHTHGVQYRAESAAHQRSAAYPAADAPLRRRSAAERLAAPTAGLGMGGGQQPRQGALVAAGVEEERVRGRPLWTPEGQEPAGVLQAQDRGRDGGGGDRYSGGRALSPAGESDSYGDEEDAFEPDASPDGREAEGFGAERNGVGSDHRAGGVKSAQRAPSQQQQQYEEEEDGYEDEDEEGEEEDGDDPEAVATLQRLLRGHVGRQQARWERERRAAKAADIAGRRDEGRPRPKTEAPLRAVGESPSRARASASRLPWREEERYAATRIQAAARGRKARRTARQLAEKQRANQRRAEEERANQRRAEEERANQRMAEEAASTLQTAWRGHHVRAAHRQQHDAARRIQSRYRTHAQQRRLVEGKRLRRMASVRLQAVARGYRTRRSLSRMHSGIRRLQSAYRLRRFCAGTTPAERVRMCWERHADGTSGHAYWANHILMESRWEAELDEAQIACLYLQLGLLSPEEAETAWYQHEAEQAGEEPEAGDDVAEWGADDYVEVPEVE